MNSCEKPNSVEDHSLREEQILSGKQSEWRTNLSEKTDLGLNEERSLSEKTNSVVVVASKEANLTEKLSPSEEQSLHKKKWKKDSKWRPDSKWRTDSEWNIVLRIIVPYVKDIILLV